MSHEITPLNKATEIAREAVLRMNEEAEHQARKAIEEIVSQIVASQKVIKANQEKIVHLRSQLAGIRIEVIDPESVLT